MILPLTKYHCFDLFKHQNNFKTNKCENLQLGYWYWDLNLWPHDYKSPPFTISSSPKLKNFTYPKRIEICVLIFGWNLLLHKLDMDAGTGTKWGVRLLANLFYKQNHRHTFYFFGLSVCLYGTTSFSPLTFRPTDICPPTAIKRHFSIVTFHPLWFR